MGISRARPSLWLSFWLVVALLWAPIWGQWHSIEHRELQAVSAKADAYQTHGHEDALAVSSAGSGADLWGHDAGSDLCQLLDHLGHSDRLITENGAWSAPMVPVQAPLFLAHFSFDHHRWSQPQARAPPALI